MLLFLVFRMKKMLQKKKLIFCEKKLGTFFVSIYETKLVQNSSNIYTCNFCDYSTSRKSQYERHLLTSKNILKQNETRINTKSSKKTYTCECGMISCNILLHIVTHLIPFALYSVTFIVFLVIDYRL